VKSDLCGTFAEEMVYDLCYFYHQDVTRLHTPIRYSQCRTGLDPRVLRLPFTVKNVALGNV
jgi:hypothetical protein